MKKIFALVLTFVMIFSISASAASGLVPANLQYNNIKINLNGTPDNGSATITGGVPSFTSDASV